MKKENLSILITITNACCIVPSAIYIPQLTIVFAIITLIGVGLLLKLLRCKIEL